MLQELPLWTRSERQRFYSFDSVSRAITEYDRLNGGTHLFDISNLADPDNILQHDYSTAESGFSSPISDQRESMILKLKWIGNIGR